MGGLKSSTVAKEFSAGVALVMCAALLAWMKFTSTANGTSDGQPSKG